MKKKRFWIIIVVLFVAIPVTIQLLLLGLRVAVEVESSQNSEEYSVCLQASSKVANSVNHMKSLGSSKSKEEVRQAIEENISFTESLIQSNGFTGDTLEKYKGFIAIHQVNLDALVNPDLNGFNETGQAKLDLMLKEVPNLCSVSEQ